MTEVTEAGTAVARAILDAIVAAIDAYNLPQPAIAEHLTGASLPTADACDGMVWTRVGTVYPTDGSGAPFAAARIGWDVPAWCFPIEAGVLWCHTNITPDGGFIDADEESDFAQRDGAYRFAVMQAVVERWRPTTGPLAAILMGQSLLPWQPIGPDGGYSGGIMVSNVIASALAICE